MKTKTKRQWTQFVAVAAAAACAVSATVAGVNYSFAPISVSAMEAGTELTVTPKEYTNDEGETGCNFEVSLAGLTEADAGETIYVTFTAPKYAGQNLNGSGGYCDPDNAYEWVQMEKWTATADADGVYTVEFETNATMIKYGTLQVQSWDPNGLEVESCVAVFGEASEEETTTTTTTTTSSEESDTTTTTTTTTASSDSSEETTTTTVSSESSDSSEETTTTTTTTTSSTTTTNSTTATSSVTLETKIDFTQEKDADGNPIVKIDTMGADYVTVVMKVLTSDTEATLAYQGTYGGEWDDDKYEALSVGTDKIVTHTYAIRDDLDGNALTIAAYWPTSVTFQSITLKFNKAPETTTASTTTTVAGDKVTTETETIGLKNDDNEEQLVINLQGKVLAVITAEGAKGDKMSGGFYVGKDDSVTWNNVIIDGSESYTIMYENTADEAYGTYQIYYNGDKTKTKVTYKTYTRYDVSMNDAVNGSDVLALAKYLTNDTKTEIQDIIADINDDDTVSIADSVALVKVLLAGA